MLQRPKNDDYAIIGGHVSSLETIIDSSEYWLTEEQIKQIEENGQSVEDTIIIDDELYEKLLKIAEEDSEYFSEKQEQNGE